MVSRTAPGVKSSHYRGPHWLGRNAWSSLDTDLADAVLPTYTRGDRYANGRSDAIPYPHSCANTDQPCNGNTTGNGNTDGFTVPYCNINSDADTYSNPVYSGSSPCCR